MHTHFPLSVLFAHFAIFAPPFLPFSGEFGSGSAPGGLVRDGKRLGGQRGTYCRIPFCHSASLGHAACGHLPGTAGTAIPPFCSAFLPFRYSAILLFCHSAILPFYHSAILPFRHFAFLPFRHSAILPFCHPLSDCVQGVCICSHTCLCFRVQNLVGYGTLYLVATHRIATPPFWQVLQKRIRIRIRIRTRIRIQIRIRIWLGVPESICLPSHQPPTLRSTFKAETIMTHIWEFPTPPLPPTLPPPLLPFFTPTDPQKNSDAPNFTTSPHNPQNLPPK